MHITDAKRFAVGSLRRLSVTFGLPMAVVLLFMQLVTALLTCQSQSTKIEQDLHSRGQSIAAVIAGISASFIINYDMTALEDIVTNLMQQEGVRWAVFSDAQQQALTKKSSVVADNATVVFTQEITADGQHVGSLQMGLSTASMTQALTRLYLLLGLSTVGVTLVMVLILAWLFSVKVSQPLGKIMSFAQAIAAGHLHHSIAHHTRDEVGRLASTLNTMAVNLRQMLEDMNGSTLTVHAASSALTTASEQMAHSVSAMTNTATSTAAIAKETSANMALVVVTAQDAANNVHSVATATEEMTATISAIAQNAENARQVTATAVQHVTTASHRVDELGSAAHDISQVTDVILALLNKPSSWHSMRLSRRRVPVRLARALLSSPMRSKSWPNRPMRPRQISAPGSRLCNVPRPPP